MPTVRALDGLRNPGVLAALGAAALFGLGTPLAKRLSSGIDPWFLAGLFYAGSGIALSVPRWFRPRARPRLTPAEWIHFAGAIAAGGIVAPVLLMHGVIAMPAAGASLLLNAEGIFTALLAWIAFRENVDRRILAGMLAIVAGTVLLSWDPAFRLQALRPSLLVLAACFFWGLDNNLTRKVALLDATWIAAVKGIVAGSTNLLLALLVGAARPGIASAIGAMLVGAVSYGLSLVLFITALRYVGTARTSAYYSVAPFLGATAAIAWLHEPVTVRFLLAAVLMGIGVWLHLTERHEHEHSHAPLEHEHEHVHDEHHRHLHADDAGPDARHTHRHRHDALTHTHIHYPDSHHDHDHGTR